MNKETESQSKRAENLEVNVAYIMAMALERILNDIEESLSQRGVHFKFKRKQRFNNIIKAIKEVKRNVDIMDYEDFAEDLKTDCEAYQYFQEDSLELVRLILLFADRQSYSVENANEVFKLLRNQKGMDVIDESILKKFYLNK